MRIVRVESRKFVATFKSDGVVREADAQLAFMLGWPDAKVRAVVKRNKWRAVVVSEPDLERSSEQVEQPRRSADYQPLVFRCAVCGAEACFGYGVALIRDVVGTWYCRAHRPGGDRGEEEAKGGPHPAAEGDLLRSSSGAAASDHSGDL